MTQRVIDAATAANASTIGLPHATAMFLADVQTAHVLSYAVPPEPLMWLQDRACATILADPSKRKLPTQNALMKQCRLFCVKGMDDTWFQLQAVNTAGQQTAKYLRWKAGDRQRVLFLEATLDVVKKYYGDPMVHFVLPKPDPATVSSLQHFFSRYRRARGDVVELLKDVELPPRVYPSYEKVFELGMKFHTLLGVDVGYSLSKYQVDFLMRRLGALRFHHVMFLPPELAFPYFPKSQYYGIRLIANAGYRDRNELAESLSCYKDAIAILMDLVSHTVVSNGVSKTVTTMELYVELGVHKLRCAAEFKDDAHVLSMCDEIHSRKSNSQTWLAAGAQLDVLDMLYDQMTLSSMRPCSWKEIAQDIWRDLKHVFAGETCATAHVWFEGQGMGTNARGYFNDWATWQSYVSPAWEVRAIEDDSIVNNYSIVNHMQFGYHVLQSITRHTHGGPVVSTWRLHPADEYVRVMNVQESLTRFGSGIKKELVYDSYPAKITGELVLYLASLSSDSLMKPDAPANALLWLRKRLVHVTIGGQSDGRISPIIPVEKMPALAYGVYFQVLDQRQLLREAKEELQGSPVFVTRLRTWFFSKVDKTILGDFVEWLVRRRWFNKFILNMPAIIHSSVVLSEQYDRESSPTNFFDAASVSDYDDAFDAPNLPPEAWLEELPEMPMPLLEAKVEPGSSCMICAAAKLCGMDPKTMVCSHNDPTVKLTVPADEWRTFLLMRGHADVETPEQIKKLDEQVKESYKGFEEISGTAKLYNVTGLPGTGKSHMLRALGVYLRETEGVTTIGLYSPFAKLYNDYKYEAKDYMGRPLGKLFSFKTTHRAMLEFVGLKYIFVEEFGAVNFHMLAPLIERNPGVTFVCCGDINQTQLQAHEGKNVYGALDMASLNNHTLTLNRRNPPEHVAWANNFLPKGLKMLAHKTESSPVQVVRDSIEMDLKHPRWRTEYSVFAFSKNTFKAVMGDQTADGNPMKAVTVRSCQGSTFQKGVLLVSDRDIGLLKHDGMSLVALTRCTDLLVVYVQVNRLEINAWLSRCEQVLDHENLNLPAVDFKPLDAPLEEPKLEKPRQLATGVDEGIMISKIDYAAPSDQDHMEVEVAHGMAASATAAVAKYEESCDAGVALTNALNPVQHEVDKLQLADMPRNIPNYAVAAKIVSSALRRANARLPNKDLSPGDEFAWRTHIDKYFDVFKHKITLDAEVLTAIWEGIVKDAQQRHYWERLVSVNAENPDPEMIGVMDKCLGTKVLQMALQRISVKESMKMNNSAKVDSIFAAAQTIASQPVWQWFQFTFLERLTAYIDKATDNQTPRVGKGVLLSRHAESDLNFIKKSNDAIAQVFSGRMTEMAYTDGNKTDSGGTKGSVKVLELYRKKLITMCNVSDIMERWFADMVMLMYRETRCNPALAAHVRFTSAFQTPSGYVGTFSDAMIYCSLATMASIDVGGSVVLQKGGDDGAVAADHISENVKGAELVERTSNIEIRVVDAKGLERVLDFTGLLIYSGYDQNTRQVHNCVVQNIVRKYYKVYGSLFKDEKHIGQAMVPVRQLTKELEQVEDFYEDVVYANACHFKQIYECDMSTAIDAVQGFISELKSLVCTKAKDIADSSFKRRRPIDPQSRSVAAGSSTYELV